MTGVEHATLASTVTSSGLAAVAGALLGWTAWTAFQSREKPSAEPFVAILAALALWAAFKIGSGLLPSGVWELGPLGCAFAVPGLYLVYALGYTGRGTGLTWRRIAMLAGIALPVVLGGIVIALRPPDRTAERLLASLLGTEVLYLVVLFSYATYRLIGLARTQTRVSKGQIAIVTAGIAAPYLGGMVGNDTAAVDGVTGGLLLSGLFLTVSVRRYPVLTGFPKADYVARTRVVEALQEAVVVLDWDGHVLDVNATTAELFAHSPAAMIGKPLRSVVDGIERCDLSEGATGTATLQTTKGRRQFQFSVSAVEDEPDGGEDEGEPVARAVLFRDVTDRQTREQRLTVLNRILRHNVRNKLDVVLAHAEQVTDEDLREGIREGATDLVALSGKAREAEEVMTATVESPDPVDLTDVVATVTDEYRSAYPDADISLTCPAELRVSSHRPVVEQVLSEVVENALTHTDDQTPRVEVGLRAGTDAAAELTVADTGPGIPERERQILSDGSETQLKHGTGIGLWFVNWAVSQLGGDLEFSENDPSGTVVTVRLYDTGYSPGDRS